jgi:hypothetical protein
VSIFNSYRFKAASYGVCKHLALPSSTYDQIIEGHSQYFPNASPNDPLFMKFVILFKNKEIAVLKGQKDKEKEISVLKEQKE